MGSGLSDRSVQKQVFAERIVSIVDTTAIDMLGSSGWDIIKHMIKRQSGLDATTHEITGRPEIFEEAFMVVFGNSAKVVLDAMNKRIAAEFSVNAAPTFGGLIRNLKKPRVSRAGIMRNHWS